ncbi:MAG: phytanoyl-CoA dioxygenase family protein [Candidatus Latescibacterota bacterium]|nr:phytanoyl-CoA dioxygenase family protein [Candidatus Latescibacterota bacterium]
MATVNCPITQQNVAQYQERGYIQFRGFFSEGEMDRLRGAIDEAIAINRDRILGAGNGGRTSEAYERVFNQMVNLWVDFPLAKEFAFSKRLAEAGRQLSQARHVRIYHDHAMVKPPGQESKETNWHQDAPYWPMDPVGSFSAWIAVDDVTEDNGCLHFVPGSHRFGRLEPIKLGVEGESIVAKMKEQGHDVAEPETMAMEAGGVTFHHGCNFHYAGPNHTGEPRRAFAIIYIPDHVMFTGDKDAAGASEEMQVGNPWDHPVHPILAGE